MPLIAKSFLIAAVIGLAAFYALSVPSILPSDAFERRTADPRFAPRRDNLPECRRDLGVEAVASVISPLFGSSRRSCWNFTL